MVKVAKCALLRRRWSFLRASVLVVFETFSYHFCVDSGRFAAFSVVAFASFSFLKRFGDDIGRFGGQFEAAEPSLLLWAEGG